MQVSNAHIQLEACPISFPFKRKYTCKIHYTRTKSERVNTNYTALDMNENQYGTYVTTVTLGIPVTLENLTL